MSGKPPAEATPIAFVQAIVAAYARRGMDPSGALAQAQIAPSALAQAGARITSRQMERVSELAMRELDDEALGWFERRLPWGSYGMLARASISAPELGLALARWCRHHGLLTDTIRLHLRVEDGVASIAIEERRDLGALREFCQVSVLRNAHGLASWLIDSRIPLLGADFQFSAPPHRDVYAWLFTPQTRFDAGPTAIRFDARYLSLPLRRDEAALRHMLRHALPLMVQSYRRDRLLVERARQWLAAAPGPTPAAGELAQALHLSVRTLHRLLAAEGATLQQLKDEARRGRAIDALLRTRRPVKQVAQAAGFGNEKSFIRAFRLWTGETPAAYRRRLSSAVPPASAGASA